MDPTSIPVVGKILEKISDIIVAALFSHLNYMFCSKSLVEDLKSENEKLEIVENLISKKAEEESNNGRILEKHVVDWKKEAGRNQEKVGICLEKYRNRPSGRCFRCLPIPHPFSRYKLGKKAESIAKTTTSLTTSGYEYLANQIAYLPLDMNAPVTEFQTFESREEAYQKLKGLVTNSSCSILGIYGIAGAGKTRLMERITTEAGKEGTFDKVVRANVGNEKLDVIGIQEQLAGKLGCKFQSETDSGLRANQLRSSLRQGGKVLVILDDIWRVIPLDTIGILSADGLSSIGGKILLTSRSEEVCKLNKCEHPVKIEPLTFPETWNMFCKTVGAAKIDSLQNISLAKDICKRCGGLPLVILAVGNALKYKPLDSWKDARNQLKNSKIERVSGIHGETPGEVNAYACLKWSFDNLEDDAKACLLLASIFAEDAHIPIRALVQLAKGSQLLAGGQIRVRSMLYILKSSSLLQEKHSQYIKLHDIIRDMARSIATKDYGFLFARSGSLPNNPSEYSALKFLHIDVEDTHFGFPSDVECPTLHTLSLKSDSGPRPKLQEWVSHSRKFANLTFLVLHGIFWPRELSLESLDNLRTLWLNDCFLLDFGRDDKYLPEKLENLCIWDSVTPKYLNLWDLNRLRKLEIDGTIKFNLLPNTISRLSNLEELRLLPIISVASPAVLDEISKLRCLTSLGVRSQESISSELATLFPNLSEFQMIVGEPSDHQTTKVSSVPLTKSIKLFNHNLVEDYQTLIEKAEEVILCGTGFTGSIEIRDSKEFIDLSYMHIEDCEVMEYLARMSPQSDIQENIQQSTPFSNLIKLEIKRCSSLKYLFCNSVARCLGQLQELKIKECCIMKEVIRGEGTGAKNIIKLSKLRILILNHLPRLVRFYKDKKDSTPSHQIQPLFDRNSNQMVAFPSLEELNISHLEDITDIWLDNYDNASSFSQLKNLSVIGCGKLENVIPPVHTLPNSEGEIHRSNTAAVTGRASEGHVRATVLKKQNHILLNMLKKTVCMPKSVRRRIPTTREEHLDATPEVLVQVLPRITRVCPLVRMSLLDLPSLKNTGLNFRDHSGAVILFTNLESLEISRCYSLENVFMPSLDRQVMTVTECDEIREIIGTVEQGITNGIEFPKLRSFVLTDLPVLTSFGRYQSGEANSHKVGFPNLKTLELRCGEITGLETIELGRNDSLEKLTIVHNGKEIKIPNRWLLHLNNLESLSLRRCWSDELKSLHFQNLKSLTLCELSCSTIFSFPDFERLQQLQELEIRDCDSLEQIVEVVEGNEASGMDTDIVVLVQLESVILVGLPKLKNFIHTKSNNLIRSLEQEEVEPSILFTCSVFGILQQLKQLTVSDCRLLEGIVEVARGYETCDGHDKIITFPLLSAINLRDLPSLQNFSPTTIYSFKMPELKYFYLIHCPQAENKPFLQIITEQVIHVYSDEHPGGINVENLNDYTRRINNLESHGESAHSNLYVEMESDGESSDSHLELETESDGESSFRYLDVETETMRVEGEEERVVEQGEEGVLVEEEKGREEETLKSLILNFLFFLLKKVLLCIVLFLFFKEVSR